MLPTFYCADGRTQREREGRKKMDPRKPAFCLPSERPILLLLVTRAIALFELKGGKL